VSSTKDDRGPVPHEELQLEDTTSIRIQIRELQSRLREHRKDLREHEGRIGELRVSVAELKVHVRNLTRAFWLVGGAIVTGLTAGFLAVLRHLP
jgi:hypothetical protein